MVSDRQRSGREHCCNAKTCCCRQQADWRLTGCFNADTAACCFSSVRTKKIKKAKKPVYNLQHEIAFFLVPACLSVCWDYLYTVIHMGVRDKEKSDTQISAPFIPHAAVCSPTCPLPARLASESYENFFPIMRTTQRIPRRCVYDTRISKRERSHVCPSSADFFFIFLPGFYTFACGSQKQTGGKKLAKL